MTKIKDFGETKKKYGELKMSTSKYKKQVIHHKTHDAVVYIAHQKKNGKWCVSDRNLNVTNKSDWDLQSFGIAEWVDIDYDEFCEFLGTWKATVIAEFTQRKLRRFRLILADD